MQMLCRKRWESHLLRKVVRAYRPAPRRSAEYAFPLKVLHVLRSGVIKPSGQNSSKLAIVQQPSSAEASAAACPCLKKSLRPSPLGPWSVQPELHKSFLNLWSINSRSGYFKLSTLLCALSKTTMAPPAGPVAPASSSAAGGFAHTFRGVRRTVSLTEVTCGSSSTGLQLWRVRCAQQTVHRVTGRRLHIRPRSLLTPWLNVGFPLSGCICHRPPGLEHLLSGNGTPSSRADTSAAVLYRSGCTRVWKPLHMRSQETEKPGRSAVL